MKCLRHGIRLKMLLAMAIAAVMLPGWQTVERDRAGFTARAASASGQPVSPRPPGMRAETERAIQRGLAYLASTQRSDGSWRTHGGQGNYPVAMTSMAGIALLAGGNTPSEGPYAANVRRAVNYIVRAADRNSGLIARRGEEQRPMYAHGFSMLFLAEVYGMETDPRLQERIRQILNRAVKLTSESQSTYGGWYYTPDSSNDEGSVTITQVQGLRACRNAGILVPAETIEQSTEYIEKSANDDGGIRYTARRGGNSLPAITAQAVASLNNAGEYEHPVGQRSMEYIRNLMRDADNTRVFRGHYSYSIFYASQAMYLSANEDDWAWFYPMLQNDLLDTQQDNGSWEGDFVGPTYGTATAVTALALPYGYVPIFQR